MSQNEEELEFISVADEDNDLNNYMDPSQQDASNNAMGSWIFTQSKVQFYYSGATFVPSRSPKLTFVRFFVLLQTSIR
jgi:hypothetical protein